MKLNVFFIKGKTLILTFFSLLLLILSIFSVVKGLNTYDETIPTMAKPQLEEYLKYDLNGDSKDDLLYITCKNDRYYIESHINNKTYFFNTKTTLGSYDLSHPLSVKLIDINDDLIPEVITQGLAEANPIIHIFMWCNGEFKDIFSSNDNSIAIFNSLENKKSILYPFSIYNTNDLSSYILEGNSLKKISLNNSSIPCIKTVNEFVHFVESTEYNLPNIFSKNISNNDLSTLYNLKNENYKYIFQDLILYNDNSNTYSLDINFKKYNEYDCYQIKFNISIDKIEDNFFISSIKTIYPK